MSPHTRQNRKQTVDHKIVIKADKNFKTIYRPNNSKRIQKRWSSSTQPQLQKPKITQGVLYILYNYYITG